MIQRNGRGDVMAVIIKVLDPITLGVKYFETLPKGIVLGSDLITDEAYKITIKSTEGINQGDLLHILQDNTSGLLYIDKVYKESLTYKSLLHIFDTEVNVEGSVELDTIIENTFKNNADFKQNIPWLVFNSFGSIAAGVEGVNNVRELVVATLFSRRLRLEIKLKLSNLDNEVEISLTPQKSNIFINLLNTKDFSIIDMPEIVLSYTKCTVYTTRTISGVKTIIATDIYYLNNDNTITEDSGSPIRYSRVKNKIIYKDVASDSKPEDLAKNILISTDEYLVTLGIFNNSYNIDLSAILLGDTIILNKQGHGPYKGTISSKEVQDLDTIIKVGFGRNKIIF